MKIEISRNGASALRELSQKMKMTCSDISADTALLTAVICENKELLGVIGDDVLDCCESIAETVKHGEVPLGILAEKMLKQANEIEEYVNEKLQTDRLTMNTSQAAGQSRAKNGGVSDGSGTGRTDIPVIAGVQRGTPMTFHEADTGHVNPNIGRDHGYAVNCQTCVVVFEARLRGYDVQALPNTAGSMLDTLSRNTSLAWIDPNIGRNPGYIYDNKLRSAPEYIVFLHDTVKQGQRYTIQFVWEGRRNGGHIVNLDRTETGQLRIKDNQRALNEKSEWIGDEEVLAYLSRMKYEQKTLLGATVPCVPKLMRIDNLAFDPAVVNRIMKGA